MQKYIAFIILIAFTSCIKDIAIDLDKHESKLVVNSFFQSSDSLIVHVSHSIPILDADSVSYIKNASVELFENETLIGLLKHEQNGFYGLPIILEAGQEYKLNVQASGWNSVSTLDTIPKPTPILSLDTISADKTYLYCEITFEDDGNINNYYLLELTTEQAVLKRDSLWTKRLNIINSDNIVQNGQIGAILPKIYFSDDDIQGESYELSFLLDKTQLLSSSSGNNTAFIHFKTISYDYYTYLGSMDASQDQPIDVYSNVEGGYGIFAGYNESQDSLIFNK